MQNSIGETLYRELEQVAYELIEFLDPNKDLELIKKIESRIDYWAEGNGLFFGRTIFGRTSPGIHGPKPVGPGPEKIEI